MIEVEIEYCVPCGFRKHALDIQENLLDAAEEDIERIALKPAHGGVVIVRIDEETVFHSGENEYDSEELVETVTQRVEA